MDINVQDLDALSAVLMDGTEVIYLERGNESYKISADAYAAYILGKERVVVTKVLDGTVGNGVVGYVDLFTPDPSRDIDKAVLVATSLLPDTATPTLGVVLSDGTPANDIEVFPQVAVNELNGTIKYVYELGALDIPTGFDFKLKIEGANITAGTVKTIVYYIP